MAADPYQTLGVKRDASQEEIQKAYRRLATKLHPDLNPGNKKAEEEFKNVSVAYDLLADPDKRARFDRGEIDASGAERPQQRYYRDFAEGSGPHPYASDAGFADFAGADDIFSEIFGSTGRANLRMRGQDVHYHLELDFLDAVNVLRLKRKGVPRPDGTRGDELVTLKVMLPELPDPELEKFVAQWRQATADGPPRATGAS